MVRAGENRRLDLTNLNSGEWIEDGGAAVWRLSIRSTGAAGVQVHFSGFRLPPGARFIAFSPTNVESATEFGEARAVPGQAWTLLVPGDTIVLELYDERPDRAGEGAVTEWFRIEDIGHLYAATENGLASMATAGVCNLDASCYSDWSTAGDAVVKITMSDTEYIYMCSAVVMNTVISDYSPLLLTANHCVSAPTLASSLTAIWGYKTLSCNGTEAWNLRSAVGAEILTTSSETDSTLLSVRYMPVDVAWAGWTTEKPARGTDVVGIHHPAGSYRRIMFATTTPGPLWAHAVIPKEGIVEPGSSGSPLFDPQKRVIGTLSEGSSSCSEPHGVDYYSTLAGAYDTFVRPDGKNYLEYGLPDDHFYPNSTRAEAAALTLPSNESLIIKKGAEDWFRFSLTRYQKFTVEFSSMVAWAAEFYLDDQPLPFKKLEFVPGYSWAALDGPHIVYMRIFATDTLRTTYGFVMTATEPLPGGIVVEPPTALTPGNRQEVFFRPTFSWQSSAVSFDLYLGTSSDPPFYVTVQNLPFTTSPSYLYPTYLHSNTHYYWKVVAHFEGGATAASPTIMFSTIEAFAQGYPGIKFPLALAGTYSDTTGSITNNSTDSFTIVDIRTSSEFEILNQVLNKDACHGTYGLWRGCAFQLRFRPTWPGVRTGVITLTDDHGVHHYVGISGTAFDISLEISRPVRPPRDYKANTQETTTYQLQIGTSGVNGPVILSCTNVSPNTSCLLSPSTFEPGAKGLETTLTITTGPRRTRPPAKARGAIEDVFGGITGAPIKRHQVVVNASVAGFTKAITVTADIP